MHIKTWLIAGLLIIAVPFLARAEGGKMQPPSWAPAVPGAKQGNTGVAQGGVGMISEDYYLKLSLGFDLNFGKVGVGIGAPLNILVVDKDPKNRDEAYGKILRKEDWDELSDYGKIIRYVRYGQKRDPFYLLAGELAGITIGHGTIMNRYYNALDLDHYKAGMEVDVNLKQGGVETVVNNFLAKPTLFGGRFYVRPATFFSGGGGKGGDKEDEGGKESGGSWADNFAVGATYLRDVTAPLVLKTVMNNNVPSFVADDKNNLDVDDSDDFKATGIDVEYVLLQSSMLQVIPYSDLNHLSNAGNGLHVGTLANFFFPIGIDFNISSKLEYRVLGSNYIPSYFDGFYELQRFAYMTGEHSQSLEETKLYYLREERHGKKQGYYGELALGFAGFLTGGAAYEDYQGRNNSNLSLFLAVPALDIVKVEAYYFKHNFEGLGEVKKFDERSLFMAQLKFRMAPGLYLVGAFYRQWQLDPESGQYEAADNWNVGAAYEMSF